MAIRSGFFNSVNGDRKYDAKRFAEYFASFIGNGVFPQPSDGLQVIANNDMTVTVKAGKAWINGYFLVNDDDYILQLDPADGVLPRIDRAVVRYDVEDREIRIEVKKGTFSDTPVPPALQRDVDAYELALADIYVRAGTVNITQDDITDLRGNKELCGKVDSLIAGDVSTLATLLDSHLQDKGNPHAVTAAQIGAAPASHVGSGGSAHALATTSSAGFMSPEDKQALNSKMAANPTILQEFTTVGTHTFTVPAGVTHIGVIIFSGAQGGDGGHGGAGYNLNGTGGYQACRGGRGSSFVIVPKLKVTPGQQFPVVVGDGGEGGAGATGVTGSNTAPHGSSGKVGGTSSFGPFVATGDGGTITASGGQGNGQSGEDGKGLNIITGQLFGAGGGSGGRGFYLNNGQYPPTAGGPGGTCPTLGFKGGAGGAGGARGQNGADGKPGQPLCGGGGGGGGGQGLDSSNPRGGTGGRGGKGGPGRVIVYNLTS